MLAAFCFIIALVLVLMAAVPLTLRAQVILGGVLLLVMILIKVAGGEERWRLLFVVIGIFLVARYMVFRTLETIPFNAELITFVPGILLYFAEVYAVLVMIVGFFVVSRGTTWPTPALPSDRGDYPTVDVLVPSYDESPELLATTLSACTQMRYPSGKLRVFLLDDGGTDQKCQQADPDAAAAARERRGELQQLCTRLGCNYLTRSKNDRAKAGNLNEGLANSDGDLVAVFDADHVPSAAFLEMTVGHFLEDPDLFLVQTPHFFLNRDPQERNLAAYAQQHSEHEMFYHTVQPGLDNWNSTFFCGSAALLSRAALNETDGFSGESITEDCETALNLHAMGYNSRYVQTPLIAGLQPESLKDFIKQRTRWAQGMTQIFIFNNPMFKRGLSVGQRFCYTSSMIFWIFPFARMTMVLAPLVFLAFGLQIYDARVEEFLAYTLPGLISVLLIANFLYGTFRPPLVSELYEFIQCTFLSRALLYVMLRPRAPKFIVTPKGESMDSSHISPAAGPLIALIILMLGGLVASVYRLTTQPDVRDVYAIVSTINLFNLIIGFAALGVILEQPQRRKMPRVAVNRDALLDVGSVSLPALIADASASGVRLRLNRMADVPQLSPGDFIRIAPVEDSPVDDDGASRSIGINVLAVDTAGSEIEVRGEFEPHSAGELHVVVAIVYSDYLNWAAETERRREEIGFLAGFGRFVGISLAAVGAFLRFLFSRSGGRVRGENAQRPADRGHGAFDRA